MRMKQGKIRPGRECLIVSDVTARLEVEGKPMKVTLALSGHGAIAEDDMRTNNNGTSMQLVRVHTRDAAVCAFAQLIGDADYRIFLPRHALIEIDDTDSMLTELQAGEPEPPLLTLRSRY